MQRIIVMKGGGLGDTLLALPALRALAADRSPAEVTFVGTPSVLPLVAGLAARTVSIDAPFLASGMGPHPSRTWEEFFHGHDLLLSWFGSGDDQFRQNVERALPARAFVFPPFDGRRPDGADGPTGHAAEYYLRCLRGLPGSAGIRAPGPAGDGPILPVVPVDRDGNADGRPILAIHPGSGAAYKNWPVERFASLARWAIEALGALILLVEGPADSEPAGALSRALRAGPVRLLHGLPLDAVARALAGSSCFVGNDSGISHLAAAVGCPTVALYGPTDPRAWGVKGPHAAVVWARPRCSPCSGEEAQSCPRRRCLEGIAVKDVVRRVLALLPRAGLPRGAGSGEPLAAGARGSYAG